MLIFEKVIEFRVSLVPLFQQIISKSDENDILETMHHSLETLSSMWGLFQSFFFAEISQFYFLGQTSPAKKKGWESGNIGAKGAP